MSMCTTEQSLALSVCRAHAAAHLEALGDDGAGFPAARQIQMQRIEQPRRKRNRVCLGVARELPLAALDDRLQWRADG